MSWYSVGLLFKSKHLNKPEVNPLWEERIVLIKASSEEDAKRKGSQIGKESEHDYPVLDSEKEKTTNLVRWSFAQIERVYQIEDENLRSGTELFSRYLRDSEVMSILTPFED